MQMLYLLTRLLMKLTVNSRITKSSKVTEINGIVSSQTISVNHKLIVDAEYSYITSYVAEILNENMQVWLHACNYTTSCY